MYSEEVFTEIRRRFSDYTTYNKEELFDGFKEVFKCLELHIKLT